MTLLAAGAVLLSGCGSSSSTSNSSPSSSPASSPMTSPASTSNVPCKQINSLRASLEDLAHLSISSTSASKITDELKNIEAQLAALKGQAAGAFKTQADQLSAALGKVRTAAQGLPNNPSAAQVQALTSALTGLKKTITPMISEMDAVCPRS